MRHIFVMINYLKLILLTVMLNIRKAINIFNLVKILREEKNFIKSIEYLDELLQA